MTPTLARRLSVAASLALTSAAIIVATPSSAAAQRGSSIHGTVTASDTRTPIMGARVSLVSPERVTITSDAGTFILRDVPAGKYTVYASAIGKKPDSSTVTVTAGSSATLDFGLKEGSLLLSGMVVSATRTSVDASQVTMYSTAARRSRIGAEPRSTRPSRPRKVNTASPPMRSSCPRASFSSVCAAMRSRSVRTSWNLRVDDPALMTRTFIGGLAHRESLRAWSCR